MSVMPQLISIDSDLHEDTASSVIIFVKDIVRPSLVWLGIVTKVLEKGYVKRYGMFEVGEGISIYI